MLAADADEATLLRAAHNLKPGSALPEEVAAAASPAKAAVVQAAVAEAQSTVESVTVSRQ